MAETKNHEEPAFPAKRKPDLSCGDPADFPKKTQKLEVAAEERPQNPQDSDRNSPAADEPKDELEANTAPEVEDEGEEEDDQEDYAEDESEDEESNGKAEVVDRKGKGVIGQDKGKGKMIEEDEDEDDSDDGSSDGGSELEDGDSDLSDDPLAEVDLDNILPSRTRRRQVQPGVYIANDVANNDQDDDSDDPDAL